MIIRFILLIIGFIILIKGADIFVDGASNVALNFCVSKMLIGLTIVSFCTSAPELAVSIKSMISENFDIVLGNVVGSNILNILLILGISSIIRPLNVKSNTIKFELPITLLMTTLFVVLLIDHFFDNNLLNAITRSDGVILLLVFMIFIYYLLNLSFKEKSNDLINNKMSMFKSILLTILGIIMIILGSNLVVDSSCHIASIMGVSKKMISLTIVALGTSLPELVTSITATIKNEHEIAIGNIVGSNIFNIGMVIGLPVILFGGIRNINIDYIDIVVMLLSAYLLYIFSFYNRKLTRREGCIFIIIFIIYYSLVIISG